MDARQNWAAIASEDVKPRLVFFTPDDGNLPTYIRSHRRQQRKCLYNFFDLITIKKPCDYGQVCGQYEPDLAIFESGTYGAIRDIRNTSAFPSIPKLGFLHADAYCLSRSIFLSDMDRWGVSSFFTNSVPMAEYTPEIADRLFVWPNFVDLDIYKDYGGPKLIPVLFTGSAAIHYPWRNAIRPIVSARFPTLTCPHFGWFGLRETSRTIHGREYARLLNASQVIPACGSISKDAVRKLFEIPACNSCLVTEQTPATEAAGFVDMKNCVFADEKDILDKLDLLFSKPDVLQDITNAGHQLVTSRHTLKHRDQILKWLRLNSLRQGDQDIVQPNPFGPLILTEKRARFAGPPTPIDGVDRVLLRKAEAALAAGKYDDAESLYIQCMNYWWNMPEPALGLTLCSLYKGDPRKALECVAGKIQQTFEPLQAVEPDPVEWAFFVIALLCCGDLKEATRRAGQFPSLHHEQLDHCRAIIRILNSSSLLSRPARDGRSCLSVHKLPYNDFTEFANSLCSMLEACQQHNLLQTLRDRLPMHDLAADNRRTTSGAATRFKGRREALPLIPGPFHVEVGQRLISEMRAFGRLLDSKCPSCASHLRALRSLARSLRARENKDEFLVLVQCYASRVRAKNALILGVSDDLAFTNAFLYGLGKNPSGPAITCLCQSGARVADLRARFPKRLRNIFAVGTVKAVKQERDVGRFDTVLIDQSMPPGWDEYDELLEATTILVGGINKYRNHKVARRISSDTRYHLVRYNPSYGYGYAIFTRCTLAPASQEPDMCRQASEVLQ
jgi:Glycosyl transferases group 1